MYWQEKTSKAEYTVPDTILDVVYSIECRGIPLNHTHALSEAIMRALPWLRDEEDAGIHMIHGAESGNGWLRPDVDSGDAVLHLSRRTKLELRLPKARVAEAEALTGQTLDIDGHPLTVGKHTLRPLSTYGTQFARYVIADASQSEEAFVSQVVTNLRGMGVEFGKLLCGRCHAIDLPDRTLFTRSLMIAELGPEHAVRLEQLGLGPGRKHGCGLFIPHKGIAAVKKMDDE
jgi:CRISPR-associated protein Cas6